MIPQPLANNGLIAVDTGSIKGAIPGRQSRSRVQTPPSLYIICCTLSVTANAQLTL